MSRILAAVALAALAAVALVGGSGASAQSGRTMTFTELGKGSTFKHIRNTKPKSPQSNMLGDVIVFTNRIADASGKVIGKNHAVCATTVGAPRNFLKSTITCQGSVVLGDGTMTWQGTFKAGGSTSTSTVTGGTGAYANARGVVVSKQAKGDTHDTITLVS